jgi:hypothetical protein
MATLSTTFGAATVGAQPPGTTRRWNTGGSLLVANLSGATDGKVLQYTHDGIENLKALSWDEADGSGYQRIVFRVDVRLGRALLAVLRGSGGIGSENGYYLYCTNVSVEIRRVLNGTQIGYNGNADKASFGSTGWKNVEFEAVGDTIRWRFWVDGGTPGAWLGVVDSTHAEGWVGIGGTSGGLAWSCDHVTIEYVGSAPPVPDTPTLTSNPGTGFAWLHGSAYSHPQSKAHAATEFDLGGVIIAYATPETQHLEDGLDPGTFYSGRRVRYQDEDGEWSEWSAAVSVTTLDVPRPNTPTVVAQEKGSDWVLLRSGAYSHSDAAVAHVSVRFRLMTPGGVLVYESDVLPVDAGEAWRDHSYADEDNPLTSSTNYVGGVQHLGSDGVWSLWGEVAFATYAHPLDPPPPPEDQPFQGPLLVREQYYGLSWAKVLTPAGSGALIRKYGLLDAYVPVLAASTIDCGYGTVQFVPFVAGTQSGGELGDRPGTVVVYEGPGWYTPTVQPFYSTSSFAVCSGNYPDAYAATPFFVPPTLAAPRIEAPDETALLTAASVTVRLAAISPAPLDAVIDAEYSSDGVTWSPLATGSSFGAVETIVQLPLDLSFDARSGAVEVEWDISVLPIGVYQLRTRMRAPVDEEHPRPLLAGSGIVGAEEVTRWRYGVPLYVRVPGVQVAPGDSLDDFGAGGVLHAKEWSANPLRSRLDMSAPYYGGQNSGVHWQQYLPPGEPTDVEVVAQVQSRAWSPGTSTAWQFNAQRSAGVGAMLSGENATVWDGSPGSGPSHDGTFGLAARVVGFGGWVYPEESTLPSARSIAWDSNLVYARSAANVRLSRRDNATTGGLWPTGISMPHGYVHEWVPVGLRARDPWYSVRMRVTTLAIHADGRRNIRVRVQAAGPDMEPEGPDSWQIDTTLTNVDFDCGYAGLVAEMGSTINPDVQTHFRGLMVLPLDYGPCGPAEPPSALDIKTNVYCEQLTVWGINHEGIQPPSLLEAELVISWVSTGIELYSTVGTTTEWKFPAGQFPTDVMLEAKVRWQDTYTELWSDWSSLQFVIDSMPRIGQLTLVSPLGDVELDDLTEIQLVWKLEGGTTDEVTYSGWATHNGTRVSLFSGITATQYNLDLTRFVTGSIFVQIDAYGPCDTRTILYFVLEREAAEELCWPIEEVRIGPLNTIKDLATAHLETVDKLNELIRCFNISMETIWERLWPDVKPRK